MYSVVPVGPDRVSDLDRLFGCDEMADRCWCLWFIRPVKEFHEVGRAGNRAALLELIDTSPEPVGLLAYDGDVPVGWCAAGPRSRYTRILRAPTLRTRDRSEDETVWLVPCFFVHPDRREAGVAGALLDAAVELARHHGAPAIEGFPLAGGKRRSKGSDFQTGVESLFAEAGFEPVHRPSANRVIMGLSLTP